MKNKKLIYFFAITLSIIFSIIYLLIFHYYIPSSEEESKATMIYLNQIGLYKDKANADKVASDLQSNQITGYIYKKEDVYVVACGVSKDESETQKVEEQLKALSYSYINKQISINDVQITELIDSNKYQEALELIGNQS